ncbi:unnamed protein product [Arctogadus glacialis]
MTISPALCSISTLLRPLLFRLLGIYAAGLLLKPPRSSHMARPGEDTPRRHQAAGRVAAGVEWGALERARAHWRGHLGTPEPLLQD